MDDDKQMPEPENHAENSGVPAAANGASADAVVDLDAFLAELSARLVTAEGGRVALARPVDTLTAAPVERKQIMVFTLSGTRYGLPLEYIGEVLRDPVITIVPGLPKWVMGVTNLHGDVLSVVDLGRFLGFSSPLMTGPGTLLLAKVADQRVGLLVDDVELIYSFPMDLQESPPFRVEPELVNYLQGAVEREGEFIRLLDGERLLLGPEMQQFS